MKNLMAYISIIILTLCFVGCTTTEKNIEKQEELSMFPMTIIDQANREVLIKKEPERIVSGYQISSYSLITLGLADRVVGIENKPEAKPYYAMFAEEMAKQTQVGSMKELNVEEIISLGADLVIVPVQQEVVADKLQDIGIATMVVHPESHKEYVEMINLIAKVTNTEDRAEKFIDFYKDNLNELNKRLENVNEIPSVHVSSSTELLRATTKDMFQAGLIKTAMGRLITEDVDGNSRKDISLEQLVAYNPEYIFMAASPGEEVEISFVKQDPLWQGISAVANDNIYMFPSKIDSWDQPSFCGILAEYWLVNKMHPDIVTNEEVETIVKEYYKLFFDTDVSISDIGL